MGTQLMEIQNATATWEKNGSFIKSSAYASELDVLFHIPRLQCEYIQSSCVCNGLSLEISQMPFHR